MKHIKTFNEFLNESNTIKINEGAFSGVDKEVMAKWKETADEFKAVAKEIKSLEPKVENPLTSDVLALTKTLLPGYDDADDDSEGLIAINTLESAMEDLMDDVVDEKDIAKSKYFDALSDVYNAASEQKNIQVCLQLMKKCLPLAKKLSALSK